MLKRLLLPLVPYIVPIGLVVLLAVLAVNWFKGLGYKAEAELYRAQVHQLQGTVALKEANNVTLRGLIADQNTAIEVAATKARNNRVEALKARDAAIKALRLSAQRYNELRQQWPADCVQAVSLVRVELGL